MQKLTPGDLVRVRRARWRIVDVRPCEECQIVTLAGVTGGVRRVIAPFDAIERVDVPRRARVVGPRRWRRVCRALLASDTPPGGLRCGRTARMDLLAHQLEPALAVLRGLGSRLLLADDVGLGKTMQAGLVIAELLLRDCAERVLILTPAGVRDQWSTELAQRLEIDAAIFDAPAVRQRVAVLPVGLNPWTTMRVAIASIDYVKRAEVLPAVASCRWDIVVIDEAHGVAGDSDRYRAAAALCSRAAYVLLLTATPHSGDGRAFASLCQIGAQADDPLMIFRRSRRDVRLGVVRRVHRLHVRPSPQERRMHALLARFTAAVRDEHGDRGALALSVLHKRALSSSRSLERSIERRLAALAVDGGGGARQLALPLDDGHGERNPDDEVPAWNQELSLADPSRERRMLEALKNAAHNAAADETKMRALRRLLRRVAEPVVVFTEYRDTLFHLQESLDRPALLLHGGLSRDERSIALAEFSSGRCATLLATDAAAEGLNLHQRCRFVVNLELPWNPMRLEQRIGRVDRIGQQRTVHAVHLIARDTGEPRILDRLKARLARARTELDVPDPIGCEEERRVAAAIVGAAGNADQAPDTRPQAPDRCEFPWLAPEAFAEAARLASSRALLGGTGERRDDRPCVARTRRAATRAWLRGRTLLLVRAACEDGEGRGAGSTLIPFLVQNVTLRALRHDTQFVELEDDLSSQIANRLATWRADVSSVVGAFHSARLRRERAIAAETNSWTPRSAQPGLFDRRADRSREADAALRRDVAMESCARLDAVERAATLSYPPPRIVLAMVP